MYPGDVLYRKRASGGDPLRAPVLGGRVPCGWFPSDRIPGSFSGSGGSVFKADEAFCGKLERCHEPPAETGLCDSGRWRGIGGGKESRGIQYAVHGGHAPVPKGR